MFTKKLKKAVKETKKAVEDVKKVVKKTKNVEAKNLEAKKVIDHTKDLKDTIKAASKLKGVRGFIVLVDAQTDAEKDKPQGTGLKSICGSGNILANLIGNIDKEVMDCWRKEEEFKKLLNGGIDDLLKAVIKLSKDN